jgi:hypothetical protein
MAIKSIFSFGKKKKRSKKVSTKPSSTLIKKCIRLKIKVTRKIGNRRVYKSNKLLKKLLAKKTKSLKKLRKNKSRFGVISLRTGYDRIFAPNVQLRKLKETGGYSIINNFLTNINELNVKIDGAIIYLSGEVLAKRTSNIKDLNVKVDNIRGDIRSLVKMLDTTLSIDQKDFNESVKIVINDTSFKLKMAHKEEGWLGQYYDYVNVKDYNDLTKKINKMISTYEKNLDNIIRKNNKK